MAGGSSGSRDGREDNAPLRADATDPGRPGRATRLCSGPRPAPARRPALATTQTQPASRLEEAEQPGPSLLVPALALGLVVGLVGGAFRLALAAVGQARQRLVESAAAAGLP